MLTGVTSGGRVGKGTRNGTMPLMAGFGTGPGSEAGAAWAPAASKNARVAAPVTTGHLYFTNMVESPYDIQTSAPLKKAKYLRLHVINVAIHDVMEKFQIS